MTRTTRRSVALAFGAVLASGAGPSFAQEAPPILTKFPEPTGAASGGVADAPLGPPTGAPRHFAISYNPFTLQLSRLSANLEILVADHHALVLTPFVFRTKTNEDSFHNVFRGFGGEIGYRRYTGVLGPRGLYYGPSLLLGSYSAVPAIGATTHFYGIGGAFDLGYQAILADRWVVGLGGGVQYTVPTETFPKQELPASVYAQAGFRPRLLLSVGVAFD